MGHNRFDYVDHENSRVVNDLIQQADQIDVGTVNVMNGIRYFLKTDQHKIKTGEPSVKAAEAQMKGIAQIFNDKSALLNEVKSRITDFEGTINEAAEKLIKNGHESKANKLKEVIKQLRTQLEPIETLLEEMKKAKKEHLARLKTKILKAERVRHFKNLH